VRLERALCEFIAVVNRRCEFIETFSCAGKKSCVDLRRREVALNVTRLSPAGYIRHKESSERGIATCRLGAFLFQWEGNEHIKPSSLRNGVKFG
jgi:hypothetical protein